MVNINHIIFVLPERIYVLYICNTLSLYIYIHFCKHLLLRCVRISVKQMDKQLPGICFCRLATCAKMGMICSMCHRSACCSTTRRVAIVEHTVSARAPFCLKANERGKWKTCIYLLIRSRAIQWDLSLPPPHPLCIFCSIFIYSFSLRSNDKATEPEERQLYLEDSIEPETFMFSVDFTASRFCL